MQQLCLRGMICPFSEKVRHVSDSDIVKFDRSEQINRTSNLTWPASADRNASVEIRSTQSKRHDAAIAVPRFNLHSTARNQSPDHVLTERYGTPCRILNVSKNIFSGAGILPMAIARRGSQPARPQCICHKQLLWTAFPWSNRRMRNEIQRFRA